MHIDTHSLASEMMGAVSLLSPPLSSSLPLSLSYTHSSSLPHICYARMTIGAKVMWIFPLQLPISPSHFLSPSLPSQLHCFSFLLRLSRLRSGTTTAAHFSSELFQLLSVHFSPHVSDPLSLSLLLPSYGPHITNNYKNWKGQKVSPPSPLFKTNEVLYGSSPRAGIFNC